MVEIKSIKELKDFYPNKRKEANLFLNSIWKNLENNFKELNKKI